MSKTVIIELEFDHDNVSDADVYDYLDELMDNDILDWQFLVKPDAQRTQGRRGRLRCLKLFVCKHLWLDLTLGQIMV